MQNRSTVRRFILGMIVSAVIGLPIGAAHAEDLATKSPLAAPAAGPNDSSRPGAELPGKAARRSEAAEAWDAVKDTTSPALLEAFVKRYRNTFLAVLAMARLAELREAAAAKSSPFPTVPSGSVPASPIPPAPPPATDTTRSRAVLYDEEPSNPAGRQFVGSVTWRTEPIKADDRPDELAVHALVDIPSRRLRLTMSMKPNHDTSLPASHLIELSFGLPADFEGGTVANVPGILMKFNEQARGAPLAGLAVKVTSGFFLVGLSNVTVDRERNLQLLLERSWFDIPFIYANQRRGILAIEKGESGEQIVKSAFTAWGQPSATAQPAAGPPDGGLDNAGARR
jgi:hypothetical protein